MTIVDFHNNQEMILLRRGSTLPRETEYQAAHLGLDVS
jgi:hypothetical protein